VTRQLSLSGPSDAPATETGSDTAPAGKRPPRGDSGAAQGRIMVDELQQPFRPRHRCFAAGSCHLMADDLDELHAFAGRLGLKREWFQDYPLHPHYDLTASKRARALKLGAVFVPAREQARKRLTAVCRCVLRGIGSYGPGWWHDRDCPLFRAPPAERLQRDADRADGRPLSEARLHRWLGPWHGLQRPSEADNRRRR
jgi:hypothetical protein